MRFSPSILSITLEIDLSQTRGLNFHPVSCAASITDKLALWLLSYHTAQETVYVMSIMQMARMSDSSVTTLENEIVV